MQNWCDYKAKHTIVLEQLHSKHHDLIEKIQNFSFICQMTNKISEYQQFKGVLWDVFVPPSFILCTPGAETSPFRLSKIVCCHLVQSMDLQIIPAAHLDSAQFWYSCGGLLYSGFLSQTTNSPASSRWWWLYDTPDVKSVLTNGCS